MKYPLLLMFAIFSPLMGASNQSSLHYEIQNIQSDLQMAFERMETQESLIAALRQEVENTLTSTKGQSSGLSSKFTDVDVATKALSKDIISLRDHFNKTLNEVDRLSKEVDKQNKNIKQLETALKAIVDIVAVDKDLSPGGYKVKSGDTLEKIAKDHGTTPKAIKELNSLKKDTIFVGQNLVLP